MVDKIFKIGLLVLGSLYLAYLFCPVANQVGRYEFGKYTHKYNRLERFSPVSVAVLDTATANMYILGLDGKWERRNPILEIDK